MSASKATGKGAPAEIASRTLAGMAFASCQTRHKAGTAARVIAGTTAAAAQARRLVIGHFSARYRELDELLVEARSAFAATELALEGRVFDLRDDV